MSETSNRRWKKDGRLALWTLKNIESQLVCDMRAILKNFGQKNGPNEYATLKKSGLEIETVIGRGFDYWQI